MDRSNQGYKEPDIVLGPTVSGAAVIDSSDFWERMISDKKVVGLDMEAYGLATAVALHEQRPRYVPTWIVAKAVCDHGVEKNKADQPYAAFCSTKFVEHFISDFVMNEELNHCATRRSVI